MNTLTKAALFTPLMFAAIQPTYASEGSLLKPIFSKPSAQSLMDVTGPGQRLEKTKKGYRFEMALPGFDKKDVTITITDGNILSIKAIHKTESKEQQGEMIFDSLVEQNQVSQVIKLEDPIEEKSIHATMKNGILTINMKTDKTKKRKSVIKIN